MLSTALLVAASMIGQPPAAPHDQLKFLQPFVGNWDVVTEEEGEVVSKGQERSEWILDKCFMRHSGWGQFEGEPVLYEFWSGWNPKTQEIFQWSVGATDSLYGFAERLGKFNPNRKKWEASEILKLSDGGMSTSEVEIGFDSEEKITIAFLNRVKNNESQPDLHDAFVPAQQKAEEPTLGTKSGPGFRRLKFFNESIGKWEISGDVPGQGKWAGEEVNSWVYGKNFVRTTGWGKIGNGDRFEYLIFTGWDPIKRKVFVRIIASDGTHIVREGKYDKDADCLTCDHVGIDPSGEESTCKVQTAFLGQGGYKLRFTDRMENGNSLEDFTLEAKRIGN